MSINAQNSKVDFRVFNFDSLKVAAKKENKFLLIDCMSQGCRACIKMDKEVFMIDSVAGFLNANFICSKVQVHRLDHEIDFANLYKVDGLPTILLFNSFGELVDKKRGFLNENDLIRMCKKALDAK